MLPATNVIPLREAGSFDTDCIFGVEIGRDRSNNFAVGISPNGLSLAVRTANSKFVVPYLEDNIARLIDVTCLTVGIDPFVIRLPVQEVFPGDLVVTSDSPFSALFVVNAQQDFIRGVVPGTQELVKYVPPQNLFGFQFFVKAFSLLNAFGGGGSNGGDGGDGGFGSNVTNILPFLLCCGKGEGTKDNSILNALLLSQLFSGQGQSNNILPFLFLGEGNLGTSSLDMLLAAQALGGGFGGGGFANFAGRPQQRRRAETAPTQAANEDQPQSPAPSPEGGQNKTPPKSK
jgi:hypothetical protein